MGCADGASYPGGCLPWYFCLSLTPHPPCGLDLSVFLLNVQIPFLSPTLENTGFGIRKPDVAFTLCRLPKWKILWKSNHLLGPQISQIKKEGALCYLLYPCGFPMGLPRQWTKALRLAPGMYALATVPVLRVHVQHCEMGGGEQAETYIDCMNFFFFFCLKKQKK